MLERTPLSLQAYDRLVEAHRRALKRIELDFSFFADDVGQVDLFSAEGRIKTYKSALGKSIRLGLPIQDLDDLAGLRVVVGTLAEVPIVERFFTRQEISKDLGVIKHQRISRPNGYRAVHMVIELKGSYQISALPTRVEIQIHTIFEHAFNFLSRNWRYKQPWELSSDWLSKFGKLSQLLADIDQAASNLHADVLEVSTAFESVDLSPYSVQKLIQEEFREEKHDIADCVDACRMYVDLGYRTNGQLRKFFQNAEVAALYEFALAQREKGDISPVFSGMSKSTFWSMFGTRINVPGSHELIEKLRNV